MQILPSKGQLLPIAVGVVLTLVVLSFIPADLKAKIPGLNRVA